MFFEVRSIPHEREALPEGEALSRWELASMHFTNTLERLVKLITGWRSSLPAMPTRGHGRGRRGKRDVPGVQKINAVPTREDMGERFVLAAAGEEGIPFLGNLGPRGPLVQRL
jgi:hypothetical protein